MVPPPRILLVDDEPDILRTLGDYLGAALSVEVLRAENGPQALQLMASGPDLVISDYKMPGMDGMQLVRRIHDQWPAVPTVLLTAFPDMQLAIAALNEGRIKRFLTKPVEPAKLRQVVEELLAEHRAAAQRSAALKRASKLPP